MRRLDCAMLVALAGAFSVAADARERRPSGVVRGDMTKQQPTNQALRLLLHDAVTLGGRDVIMPVEEIRLGNDIGGAIETLEDVRQIERVLLGHRSFHVRRVGIKALRKIAPLRGHDIIPALLRHLDDPAPWVRYDAAWGLGDTGTTDSRVVTALKRIAQAPSSAKAGDEAAAKARSKAAEVLLAIERRQALASTGELRSHRNEALGVVLSLPAAWAASDNPLLPLEATMPGRPMVSIKIARVGPRENLSAEKVVTASIAHYKAIWGVERQRRVKVGGARAIELILVQTIGLVQTRIAKYFVDARSGEVIVLSCAAPVAEYEQWRPTFEKVVKSLRLGWRR